jgi:hypothetical protein
MQSLFLSLWVRISLLFIAMMCVAAICSAQVKADDGIVVTGASFDSVYQGFLSHGYNSLRTLVVRDTIQNADLQTAKNTLLGATTTNVFMWRDRSGTVYIRPTVWIAGGNPYPLTYGLNSAAFLKVSAIASASGGKVSYIQMQ